MYERFTDRSRNVMQLANQEAQRYKHEFIGTEHILLGLAKEDSGVAANVLKVFGVEPVRIIAQIERLLQEGPPGGRTDRLPQTPRAKNVIMYSMEEAQSLKHDYVGTEHLLLGLLREEEGVAAQVLMNLGVRLDTARAEIRAILSWLSEHDESGEYSPQSRIHFDKDHPKTVEEPPEACPKSTPPAACPKCGGHLVRVLWHCVHLSGQDQKDVGQERRSSVSALIWRDRRGHACVVHPIGPRSTRLRCRTTNCSLPRKPLWLPRILTGLKVQGCSIETEAAKFAGR